MQQLTNEKSEKESNILNCYKQFKNYRDTLISNFKVNPGDKIEIQLSFKQLDFENKINYLNGRNTTNNSFIDRFNENPDNVIATIFDDLELSYNQSGNQEALIRDLLMTGWYQIDYILQYDNDNFEQMSQGKKAFVILTLILEFSKDKKPVIIDQPEDSLDNRAIYQDLTKYLTRKKKDRQIILVTHNPNVVVGADTENVIVANQNSDDSQNDDKVQFDYINGSLENSFKKDEEPCILSKKGIREHVVEILEGGNEAFEKREQKYHLE